jgi:hypothetical protein
VRDYLYEIDPDIVMFEGFDDAIIGYAERAGLPVVALYDREKCIQILIEKDKSSREDTEEYLDFNVVNAYVGDHTPIFATFLEPEHN